MANFWENDPIVGAPQGAAPWENDEIVGQPAIPAPQEKSLGGFIQNVGSDAVGQAQNLYEVLKDPNAAAYGVADVLTGGITHGANYLLPEALQIKPQNPREQQMLDSASAFGQQLKNDFGSWEAIKNTLYEHPVGAALDASVAFTGGAGALRKVGARGPSRTLAKAGEYSNPVNLMLKPVSSAVQTIAPMGKPKVLQSEMLEKIKRAKYAEIKKSGIVYRPSAIDGMVKNIGRALDKEGLNVDRHPKTFSFIDDIERLKGTSPSLQELDEFRQIVKRDISNTPDPSDARFGQVIIEKIDKFTDNTSPRMVVNAGTKQARDLLRDARKANQNFRTTETFENALERGQRQAAVTGKGANTDNAIRQKINSLIDERKGRNFKMLPKDVQGKMNEIVYGTKTRNAARKVGSLAPTGIVSGTLSGGAGYGIGKALEAATGIPMLGEIGAATTLGVGHVAKHIGDVGTKRAVDDLLRIVQNGGKKGMRLPVNEQRLIKALVASQISTAAREHP
jgi:hypothetical protein